LAKIGNSKWLPGGCLSMKTMHIWICSGFYKHGWIPLKFGMPVSIVYDIIENENRVTGRSKITCFGISRTKKSEFLVEILQYTKK
jgi:hypothetical protein